MTKLSSAILTGALLFIGYTILGVSTDIGLLRYVSGGTVIALSGIAILEGEGA